MERQRQAVALFLLVGVIIAWVAIIATAGPSLWEFPILVVIVVISVLVPILGIISILRYWHKQDHPPTDATKQKNSD
ncbi:MAG: hypothetical protein J0M33_04310 [Anaerolineae bacterium]|nr:hypothetical protein [Anaerolineae bacterium]